MHRERGRPLALNPVDRWQYLRLMAACLVLTLIILAIFKSRRWL